MTKEEMETAADEIIDKLRDLGTASIRHFGQRSTNLYVAQSRMFHFKMELLNEVLETPEEVVGNRNENGG